MISDTDRLRDPPPLSNWCSSRSKRSLDILAAGLGLLCVSPVIAILGLAICLTSGTPILFRQRRAGKAGQPFQLYKFRTMRVSAPLDGPGLTRSGDSRVTWVGRWLRKTKLDELPQLFNVLRGEMTLVGPRPDLEEFWSGATVYDRRVLMLTPGITGKASLCFRQEEQLLAQVEPERLTRFYLEEVLPAKCRLDLEYAAGAGFQSDCKLLWESLLVPFSPSNTIRKGEACTGSPTISSSPSPSSTTPI